MYLRDSPIYKGKFRALVWVESIQLFLNGLTRGLYNLCETASIISSYSWFGVKYIGLTFLGPSFVYMDATARLLVEYIENYHTILQNSEKLAKASLDI